MAYSDKESISKLAEPDQEFAAFVAANPLPDIPWTDVPALRAARADMEAARLKQMGPPPSAVQESFHKVPMRDGFESEIKVHKPTNPPADGAPLFVLAFGGGFLMGNNQQLTPYSRILVQLFGATVVNISYRLAPESKFPTAHEDAWDTLVWCGANASGPELNANASKGFVLGGVSAGGNITVSLGQKHADEGITPALTGLWASIPLVFPSESHVPEKYRELWFSRTQNAKAPILDAEKMQGVQTNFQPDASSPLYSPFNAQAPGKGLPRTYIQVDGMDPLRDDGLIYDKVLRDNGVETRLDVWPGLPHGHFALMPMLKSAQRANFDTINGFAWLLKRTVEPKEIAAVYQAPAGA